MIKKEIRNPLTNDWQSIDKIIEAYEECLTNKIMIEYFNNMNYFEKCILCLYAEYDSYRKVAEETYCSYSQIKLILMVIKKDIYNLNINKNNIY